MSCCFQRECSLLPWLGSPVPPGRWPVEPGPPPSHGSHGVGARPKHTANPRDQLELPSSRGATGSGPRWAARCKQCPLPPFPPTPLHPGPQLVLSDRQPQCAFLTFSSYSQSWGLLGLYPPGLSLEHLLGAAPPSSSPPSLDLCPGSALSALPAQVQTDPMALFSPSARPAPSSASVGHCTELLCRACSLALGPGPCPNHPMGPGTWFSPGSLFCSCQAKFHRLSVYPSTHCIPSLDPPTELVPSLHRT